MSDYNEKELAEYGSRVFNSVEEGSRVEFVIKAVLINSYGAQVQTTEFHDCSLPISSRADAEDKINQYLGKLR
jgi:hypothetical protein